MPIIIVPPGYDVTPQVTMVQEAAAPRSVAGDPGRGRLIFSLERLDRKGIQTLTNVAEAVRPIDRVEINAHAVGNGNRHFFAAWAKAIRIKDWLARHGVPRIQMMTAVKTTSKTIGAAIVVSEANPPSPVAVAEQGK